MHDFIAYYRVSTQRQGRSGLGLDAQKQSVINYVEQVNGKLLNEYVEVETGKGANALSKRPQLREAIAKAKKAKAVLLIAKLDRLARNVHFVTGLMESNVKFVCADIPEANELTLHIMAAMAQYESRRISERTKEALAQAKLRGVRLGNPRLPLINKPRHDEAKVFAERLRPILEGFLACGMTQRRMVEELNQLGIKTPLDKRWHLPQLNRTLKRLALT
ncbi:recombinase family protein [Pseudodesulfovibrio sediminis]|uniref:Resolvase n=1 Tax=Pseudodesulfovibrio sediminis TaxID=2810563 RepID=A0ABM7P8W4_9BACT|nr:recombinase family protein [Pseudodesulfovibrio sediminis]BCS89470.1 resolvase [Pseudodesulfovibrio sediminis]